MASIARLFFDEKQAQNFRSARPENMSSQISNLGQPQTIQQESHIEPHNARRAHHATVTFEWMFAIPVDQAGVALNPYVGKYQDSRYLPAGGTSSASGLTANPHTAISQASRDSSPPAVTPPMETLSELLLLNIPADALSEVERAVRTDTSLRDDGLRTFIATFRELDTQEVLVGGWWKNPNADQLERKFRLLAQTTTQLETALTNTVAILTKTLSSAGIDRSKWLPALEQSKCEVLLLLQMSDTLIYHAFQMPVDIRGKDEEAGYQAYVSHAKEIQRARKLIHQCLKPCGYAPPRA